MHKLNGIIWLAVLIAMALASVGLYVLLDAQGAERAARWVGFAGVSLGAGWMGWGFYRWRDTPWVKRLNGFVITLVGFGLFFMLFFAADWETGWRTVLYLGLAVLGFLVGINLLRLILRPGHPILGVARTLIEEALRQGVSLIFIIALPLILVALPLILGSEDRVTYMVQRFLTYSLAALTFLLGLMTVLLGSWTTSAELKTKQAYMTLTKPLARWQFLLGKWLGIVLLNAVLIMVGGVAIYGFTMAIAKNPTLNDLDRYAVDREVLTARIAMTPNPVGLTWQEMLENVLGEKQARDPERFGAVGEPMDALEPARRQEVVSEGVAKFYSIKGGSSRQYRFEGLGNAVAAAADAIAKGRAMLREQAQLTEKQAQAVVAIASGRDPGATLEPAVAEKLTPAIIRELRRLLEREVIQLVLTPDAQPSPMNNFAEVSMRVNNQPWPPPTGPGQRAPRSTLVIETPNEIPLPATMIKEDGTLILEIEAHAQRLDGQPQHLVKLDYKDAQPKVFYRVGSFEMNLTKAMLIAWFKLCFLAMFGIVAGSLVSFPVAAMVSIVVFVTATFSGIIQDSLDAYISVADGGTWQVVTGTASKLLTSLGQGNVSDAFRLLLRIIGEGFTLIVPSFGEFPTADPLSSGKAIGSDLIINAGLKLGLLWTGVIGLLGLWLFSRREIARVTV